MPAIRPVSHEDRLSLVEHLTELRVRLGICVSVFLLALVVCSTQNGRLLDILNKPLAHTGERSKDPLVLGSTFDQSVRVVLLDQAANPRREAPPPSDAALKAGYLKAAADAETAAKRVPPIAARKPVTLGVSEP